jgi:hypothetical protein
MSRWIVRMGNALGDGMYLGATGQQWTWNINPRDAIAFRSREEARAAAGCRGGRVVQLVSTSARGYTGQAEHEECQTIASEPTQPKVTRGQMAIVLMTYLDKQQHGSTAAIDAAFRAAGFEVVP